ncbi:MAG: zf-HC2 domain-containing protein [Lachnospiraceae bacterium]|nr:zf-HC2 domain-containing protein [Lachnospiraceae bacterium]
MDCLKAQTCITSYVEEELTGSDLKEFLIHMEECPGCREELEIYYTLLIGTKQLDEGILTTSNFTKELDNKIQDQLEAITHWEHFSHRIHFITGCIGLFLLFWTAIKVTDWHMPLLNPPTITWSQQKYFVETSVLPHMFEKNYEIHH